MLKQVTPRMLRAKRAAWAAAMLGFLSGNIAQGDEPLPVPAAQPLTPAAVTAPATPVMPSESPALPSQPAAPHVVQAAAEVPVPPELPRSVIGDRCVELYHPRTGALLTSIPLPERGLAAVRKGDLLYVAHPLTVSIVNLRTQETHQELPSFADPPPDLPSHLRSKRLVDGLSAIYDVTDPASPQFQRFEPVDSSFHVVLAPAPTRTLNVQAQQPQKPGQALIITGSTLLGIWLAHVTGSIILIARESARRPCLGEKCGIDSLIGGGVIAGATVAMGIPGAITLGVGMHRRRHPPPPEPQLSLNEINERLAGARTALRHDRNAMIAGAALLLTGTALSLSSLCKVAKTYGYDASGQWYDNRLSRDACVKWADVGLYLGSLLVTAGGVMLPIAGGLYSYEKNIIRKYSTSPTQPTALVPLDLSVTPYASNTDFGLMATGRF